MITERLLKGCYWERAWSLVEGCTEVDSSCKNCWARSLAKRTAKSKELTTGNVWTDNISFMEKRLALPASTHPNTIFSIWNDLFHKNISDQQIIESFQTMLANPRHTFLVLTKRPERIGSILCQLPPSMNMNHVWLGTSICYNSKLSKSRYWDLANLNFRNKFVSAEPVLSDINPYDFHYFHDIRWLILGTESGPGKRTPPNHADILMRLTAPNIACKIFVKQWPDRNGALVKLPFGLNHKLSSIPF